jgi:cell division protein FtsA
MSDSSEKTEQRDYVYGLDIGTRNVVGVVGYPEGAGLHVIALSMREHKTRAMIDGQIHNIDRVAAVVREVTDELEEKTGLKLSRVCIAAAGRVLVTYTARAEYSYPQESVVTRDDLNRLDMIGIDEASGSIRTKDNEKYHFYCVGYSVAHYYLNGEPFGSIEGHKANVIAEDIIVTFLPEDVVDGLYSAVGRAGLEVANMTLEPIAAIDVAIPENFRMLNIALVDVGAGTSDICITRDGSISSYGMIPYAGDEITESLVQEYLVDFNTAEQMKKDSTDKTDITFSDIMGISHTLTAEEIWQHTDPVVEKITDAVSKKILELNGDHPVAACFVVGGGGKAHGFCESLASKLKIINERVALRGREVMNNISFDEDIEKDPLLVTPVGICLNYYDQRNNFIMINLNDQIMKLYDNGHLTIVDAAIQAGYDTKDLFPKRGKEINFFVNGEKRMVRGMEGESATVVMNGEPAGLKTPISRNAEIEITPSTMGADAALSLSDFFETEKTDLIFIINGERVSCPRFAEVNGELEPGTYEIKDNDDIIIRDHYTVDELARIMDENIENYDSLFVNNRPADGDTEVYENFSIDWDARPAGSDDESRKESRQDADENIKGKKADGFNNEPEGGLKTDKAHSINITINSKPYTLTGKESYIFIDIFTVIDFDTNSAGGRGVYIKVNGERCEYVTPLNDGDAVEIGWEEF